MFARKLSTLLLLCVIAAVPFLGSCNSTSVTKPAVCSISPTSLDFGSVALGTTADRTFAVKNTGGGTLTGTVSVACSRYSLVGSGAYNVAGGDSARFTVRFAPLEVGVRLCSVATGCDSVHLTGTGFVSPTPVCSVSPTSLNFGSVVTGQSADRTFTISNLGGGTLTGTATAGTCAGFTLVGNASYSLANGEAATITVRFSPTSAGSPSRIRTWDRGRVNPLDATVQTCSVNPGSGCAPVSCSGTGEAAPACQLSVSALDFGSVTVGQTADRTFSVTNSGGGTLSGTVATGGCTGFSVVGSATYSLSAAQSKTFTIRFAPTSAGKPAKPQMWERLKSWMVRPLNAGLQSCTVTTGCTSISASGTGIAASACQVSAASLDFGSVTVGQTKDLTFNITNSGGGTLSGTVSTSGCTGFSVVGSATYSLTAAQSKTFTIRFAPTSAGKPANPQLWERLKGMIARPQHAMLQTCTVSTGCASVSASGTGLAAVAACAVNPTSLSFGSVTVGQHEDRTFTITNNGSSTLSGTVSLSCASYSIVGSATYNIGAAQVATMTIRYSPTGAGLQTCNITTGGTCSAVSASATGVAAVSCQPSSLSATFGTWLQVDTLYTCAGAVQLVSTDTVVICADHPITDIGSLDSTFSCTITKCTSTEFDAECNGQISESGCITSYDYLIKGTISASSIRSVVTVNATFSGSCGGTPNLCQIIGSHLTKLSSDTTDCGKTSGGGGTSTLAMSCKVDGAAWTGTTAGAVLIATGGGSSFTVSGTRESDHTGVTVAVGSAAPLATGTYDFSTGAVCLFTANSGLTQFLGDASTQVIITSLNTSAKTVAGTFQFNGTDFATSTTRSITDGTFSGTYISLGSPEWLMSHRVRYHPGRR